MLANLLRNAIRHTPPGGIVVLRALRPVERGVRIEVCDTGDGIAAEDLPHIWERFYRGANGRDRDAAAPGLGLALVKELTEAMGGYGVRRERAGPGKLLLRAPLAAKLSLRHFCDTLRASHLDQAVPATF